jgi:hypothetical protein
MLEADNGERGALAVGPIELEIRPREGHVNALYHGIATDEEMASELAEHIAEETGASNVRVREVDPSRSFHALSSKHWNSSWEPKGPIPPWGPPGNDPDLS